MATRQLPRFNAAFKGFALASMMLLAACATSSGTLVKPEQTRDFVEGKTTYQQVISKLGQPNARTNYPDGSFAIAYSHSDIRVRPETFIPYVGAFVGGADAETYTVGFRFGKDNILQKSIAQNTATPSNLGFR